MRKIAHGCDAGPVMLRRTRRLTGRPGGVLIWVGAGSLLTMLVVIAEPLATRAVTIIFVVTTRNKRTNIRVAGAARDSYW